MKWQLVQQTNRKNLMNNNINESLERGDLARLLRDELHIDQFQSKMGEDKDVIVLSFKIKDKDPALDLVDFIEKGYDWVLDSDTSSGEKEDGDYLVFVEMDRDTDAPDRIMRLIADINNLTGQEISDWRWKYHKDVRGYDMTEEELSNNIPLTQEAYEQRFSKKSEAKSDDELVKMKAVAGVNVDTVAEKNEYTESLRIAAGIK